MAVKPALAAISISMLLGFARSTNAVEAFSGVSMVLSNGTITCGEFLSDSPPTQAADTEWVLGYISGRNRESSVGSRMAGASFTAPQSVTAWLQNHCRTHPLDRLADAADKLRDDFLRRESPLPSHSQ
jgi:hypothetical protein